MSKIRDFMTTAFKPLSNILTPAEAIAELSSEAYGVVLDEHQPIALLKAEELQEAATSGSESLTDFLTASSPVVVVGCELEMKDLVNSNVMTLFDAGAKGAIAVGKEGIVGVIPVSTIASYLGRGELQISGRTLGPIENAGDLVLGGDYQTPAGVVICVAPGCNYINKLADFDPDYPPPCQNPNLPPHTLKLN